MIQMLEKVFQVKGQYVKVLGWEVFLYFREIEGRLVYLEFSELRGEYFGIRVKRMGGIRLYRINQVVLRFLVFILQVIESF